MGIEMSTVMTGEWVGWTLAGLILILSAGSWMRSGSKKDE